MKVFNKLRLLVTNDCQLDCYYCHDEARRGEDAGLQLGYKGFCTVLDAGRILGFENVRISGGEPLICIDLTVNLLKAALEKGYSDVGLTTNGVLLSRYWPQLKEWVIQRSVRVGVTLNTVDDATYQSIANRSTRTLTRTLDGLQLLAHLPQTKVITVVSQRNLPNLADLLRTSAESGVLHKLVDMVQPPPGEYVSVDEIEALLEKLRYQQTERRGDYQFFENERGHQVQVPHRRYYPHCVGCSYYPCREGDLAVRVYPGGMVRSCFGAPPLYITQLERHAIASILARARELTGARELVPVTAKALHQRQRRGGLS